MGIKIPRVSVNVEYETDTSIGELSLIFVGYGLHQAWIYSSMFDADVIFGSQSILTYSFGGSVSVAFFASIIVFSLLLIVASALDSKLATFIRSTPSLVSAAVLCFAGTLMLLIPANEVSSSVPFEVVSGILTGIGSTITLLAWGVSFARHDSFSIATNGSLSIVVGFAVYAFVLRQIPFPLGGVVSALIPFAEIAILFAQRAKYPVDSPTDSSFASLQFNHAKFSLRFGLPVFLFGLVLGVLRHFSIQLIQPNSTLGDQAFTLLAICIAALIIMLTVIAFGEDGRWSMFFRVLIPIISLTVLLIPLAQSGGSSVASTVLLVGYMAFEALMWIFFGEISQRFRISPIYVFGLGRGLLALAALLGSLSPSVFPILFSSLQPGANDYTLVIVLLFIMIVAYVLLPDEREIAAITTFEPASASAASDRGRGAKSAEAIAGETVGGAAGEAASGAADKSAYAASRVAAGADASGGETQDASPDRMEKGCADPCASCPRLSEPDPSSSFNSLAQQSASGQPLRASAIVVTPREATTVQKTRSYSGYKSIFADEEEGDTPPKALEDDRERSLFRKRCESVANTYLLSKREAEVMFYLARGYKSSYVQERLYISEGTAKTHIRHIYRKLDVHSQQELIKLVDSIEV